MARMAEHGWEASRGLVEDNIAMAATDPRAGNVLLRRQWPRADAPPQCLARFEKQQ
jgi:hypothetical protein